MIDLYLKYLQEGYVFGDKNISVNLKKFESGKKNKLLIIGVTGSGKTTLGEQLTKKYNTRWISIDSTWWKMNEKYKIIKPEDRLSNSIGSKYEELRRKVEEFTINQLKSNERMIMEGVDLINYYDENSEYKKLILNQAMIILGISSLKAGIRAGIRNVKREDEEINFMTAIYEMTRFNIKELEPKLKTIRNHIKVIPNLDVKEYEVPKV